MANFRLLRLPVRSRDHQMPKPRTEIIDVHDLKFELADASRKMSAETFKQHVGRLQRMALNLSLDEAQGLRDELMLTDALGRGVTLDQISEDHPMSTAVSPADQLALELSNIRIRVIDPILD